MDLELLKSALQLGRKPDSAQNRLHEHGFGLKNALTTLTKDTGNWSIWTREKNSIDISRVDGPFGPKMQINDDASFPKDVKI
jgi:hypothetical protein